ncbi:hypothetical protein Emag_003047 [Eimeria magna]
MGANRQQPCCLTSSTLGVSDAGKRSFDSGVSTTEPGLFAPSTSDERPHSKLALRSTTHRAQYRACTAGSSGVSPAAVSSFESDTSGTPVSDLMLTVVMKIPVASPKFAERVEPSTSRAELREWGPEAPLV